MKTTFYKEDEVIVVEGSEIWGENLKDLLTSERLYGTYKIVIEDIPTVPVIWARGM